VCQYHHSYLPSEPLSALPACCDLWSVRPYISLVIDITTLLRRRVAADVAAPPGVCRLACDHTHSLVPKDLGQRAPPVTVICFVAGPERPSIVLYGNLLAAEDEVERIH